MQMDEQINEPITYEDALVFIGDIADSGKRLNGASVPRLIQAEVSDANVLLFRMIDKLAGAAVDPAVSGAGAWLDGRAHGAGGAPDRGSGDAGALAGVRPVDPRGRLGHRRSATNGAPDGTGEGIRRTPSPLIGEERR